MLGVRGCSLAEGWLWVGEVRGGGLFAIQLLCYIWLLNEILNFQRLAPMTWGEDVVYSCEASFSTLRCSSYSDLVLGYICVTAKSQDSSTVDVNLPVFLKGFPP